MIGAGIFALVGQVAGFAGDWFPIAFLGGAIVAAVSSYSYIHYSSVNPSSGGVAMLLKDAYGPGVAAGSFSLFMYVSMVVAASVVNLVGNKVVERSSAGTAVLKILGIAALAIAGLIGAAASGQGLLSETSGEPFTLVGLLAGTTLCVLAYKGFTTITNQGDDIQNPERNIARSIVFSIVICTVLYLLITTSVQASIGADGAVAARDYALAEAAEPLFGAWGVGITVAIAVVATLSGLLASLYSVLRLYAMLQDMGQAPSLPAAVAHQPLIITASLAIVATAFFDLTQIAAMGAFLYLAMDIAVQWGALRHLRAKIDAKPWVPVLAIALDFAILIPFTLLTFQNDMLTVIVAGSVAAFIVAAQVVKTRARTHE
jgi:amino acid transporter